MNSHCRWYLDPGYRVTYKTECLKKYIAPGGVLGEDSLLTCPSCGKQVQIGDGPRLVTIKAEAKALQEKQQALAEQAFNEYYVCYACGDRGSQHVKKAGGQIRNVCSECWDELTMGVLSARTMQSVHVFGGIVRPYGKSHLEKKMIEEDNAEDQYGSSYTREHL